MELALIGHELYEGRYFPQAARAYELLLGDDELTDVYAFELAVCYLQTGRLDRAAEVFESWLSGRGHDASSHLEVARQYKGVGRYEEAQAHYDKVLDLGGSEVDEAFAEAADLLVRRAETDALRRLVRVYLEHARNELRAREQAAQQLALAGLREEAVAEWRRVLALRPNHGTALTKLADLLWAMGRAEEAAAYVARLIEETGGQARNWLEAAKALKQRGAYAMALEFYDRAHAGGAREHETLVPRGEILLALGRWDEARAAFDAALAVARSQRSLLEKIGDLWEQHGRHDEALAVWQRAVTVDPKHPEHYGRLVALLLRGGEVQRARRTVLAARAHAPASLFPVGRQFEVAGHARYAAALYDEVLESGIGAHAKEAFERLAALRLAEGRRQALGPAIQRFVTGARSRAGAHRLVARLFADAARPEDAFAHARLSLREEAKDEVHEEAVRYALLAGREEEALRTAVRRVEHAETPNDATLEALADLQARGRPDLAADLAGRLEARRLSSGVTGRALVALRLAAGDTAGALAVAQRFLEGHDDPVTARRELASLLDDRGLSAEAAALLEAAVAMSEAPAAVLEELARVYLDAGDVAAGTAALRRYVEARRGDETEAEVALEAGALLQGAGRFREAAESLRVALTHPEAGRARVAYRLLLLALLAAEEPTARLREASAAFLAARADTRKAYEVALRTLLDLHLLDLARALVREGLARFPGAGSLVEQRVIVDTLGGDDEDLPASVDAFLNAAEGQDRQSRSTDLTTFFERRLRFEQAARVWARRAQQAPGAGPLRYQEARARLLGGDTAGGKAALEPWLSEAPEPAQAALQAAQLHLEVADGPAAAGHATRAVELAADDPRGWYVLGVARLVAHDAAGAEEALRRYVTLAPEAGRARLHGARRLLYGGEAPRPGGALVTDPATARRVLALLRAEAPADEAPPAQLLEAELWREAARVLAGEPGAAEALERRVAATPASLLPDPISVPGLDPGEPPPTPDLLAADVLLARGAADAADRVLLRAVRTAERPDRVLGDVFSLCRERGATELMSRWLDRLDRWFPDNPYTVTWLAEILETTGDEEGAEAAYRQALAREPRAGVYMNNLAYLFARRGRDLPEALALVRKAMRLSPASNKYYLDTEGWVLYRMGKLRQARQRILESIWLMDVQTGGAVGESFYHLGMVARDQGDREAARAAFWKAATWDRHGEYGRKSRKELEALAGGGED